MSFMPWLGLVADLHCKLLRTSREQGPSGAQVAQWWRIHLPMQQTQEMRIWSLGQEDSLEKEPQPTPVIMPG